MPEIEQTTEDKMKGWEKVFEQLYNDRAKLCSGTGFGMKDKVKDVEIVFTLGKLQATLTKDGFKFGGFD